MIEQTSRHRAPEEGEMERAMSSRESRKAKRKSNGRKLILSKETLKGLTTKDDRAKDARGGRYT
jgi:hypothetical protein